MVKSAFLTSGDDVDRLPLKISAQTISVAQAPVVRKPISANPRLNHPNPRLKSNPRLVSVPESAISAIPGLK